VLSVVGKKTRRKKDEESSAARSRSQRETYNDEGMDEGFILRSSSCLVLAMV
jgi:hypothetical protein